MKQINEILNRNGILIDKLKDTIFFDQDIEGKRLLNQEISRLYNKNDIITEQQLNNIIVCSKIIIDKMSKLKKCGWSLTELNSQLENGISYYEKHKASNFLNATKIADVYKVSSQRINNILSELGWIEHAIKGWNITDLGKSVGGIQKEHQSGGNFVIWPDAILKNLAFLKSIIPLEYIQNQSHLEAANNFSLKTDNKYPKSLLKAKDGHLVRSRAELVIDNWLYDYRLTHAYERELTSADYISDFYIPERNGKDNVGKAVYIEFWGISDNEQYLEKKKKKQSIYKSNNLNLIELEDSHLDNLDSYLRKTLLKFNINVE